LYLALVQAETTETTGQGLDQILETLQKVHDRLDTFEPPAANEKGPAALEEDAAGSRKTQQECEELQESISRLSELVGHDGAVLSDEDAGQIIDDLQQLIQSAKDHAGTNNQSSTSKETRDELRLVESMIIAAPSLSINHQGELSLYCTSILNAVLRLLRFRFTDYETDVSMKDLESQKSLRVRLKPLNSDRSD
jgi:hypothetical protein